MFEDNPMRLNRFVATQAPRWYYEPTRSIPFAIPAFIMLP
jgi:hypothetical protein